MVVIGLLLFGFSVSPANDFIPQKTPSTGYQPQHQVSGDKIYYVWHEYDGPTEPIRVASEKIAETSDPRKATIESAFEKELMQAQKISTELIEKVRGLLLKEIEQGGFSSAVRVCSELAQDMTQRFSQQTGHYLRRVSIRYRNARNVPDDYERKKLKEFDQMNREKRLPGELAEVAEEQGVRYLRYMKPLVAASLCMVCHGPKENIPMEVQAILREKYPQDRAIGFLVGDVRGAISVKIRLPN